MTEEQKADVSPNQPANTPARRDFGAVAQQAGRPENAAVPVVALQAKVLTLVLNLLSNKITELSQSDKPEDTGADADILTDQAVAVSDALNRLKEEQRLDAVTRFNLQANGLVLQQAGPEAGNLQIGTFYGILLRLHNQIVKNYQADGGKSLTTDDLFGYADKAATVSDALTRVASEHRQEIDVQIQMQLAAAEQRARVAQQRGLAEIGKKHIGFD